MKSFSKNVKNTVLRVAALTVLLVGSQMVFAQQTYLEIGKMEATWWSAMWSKEVVKEAPAFVRIKNRALTSDLHNEAGVLLVGQTAANWWSAMWELEPVSGEAGFFRIKNRNTKAYLHNETGQLALGKIQPNWWSAMWKWEPVSGATNYFRIKNRNTGAYLHTENKKVYPHAVATGTNTANTAKTGMNEEPLNDGSSLYYNPPPREYNFAVTNSSMWLVSFRVYSAKGWSNWTDVNMGGSISITHEGLATNYEIQYKDIAAWKSIPVTSVMSDTPKDQSFTITGNTLTGIKMK